MTENARTGTGAAQKMSEDFSAAASSAATTATRQMNEGVEATVARIRELNERAIEAARSAGLASLDAYEKALQSFGSREERLGDASPLGRGEAVGGVQAEFVQNISGTYLTAAREVLNPGGASSSGSSAGSSTPPNR